MDRIGSVIETDSNLLLNRDSDTFIHNNSLTSHSEKISSSCLSANSPEDSGNAMTEIWSKVSAFIKPEIDERIYEAWFKPLKISTIEITKESDVKKAKVSIAVPNKFSRDHLKTNYSKIIENCFSECTGYPTSLSFHVEKLTNEKIGATDTPAIKKLHSNKHDSESKSRKLSSATISGVQKSSLVSSRGATPGQKNEANLNTGYNFSNFVVGSCNQFAHAACLKVSESPGTSYNPLLIYGGVGLGKTHLANAVGNAAHRRGKKVLLASSETFVSELISSLRTNSMDKFKAKFRSLDILIIDDIQFIIGKERTQEEFFHTFNELYGKKKQIIITSDKLPQDLIGLEERLRTRFASGLSVDLQAPDFETRVAILTKKAELSGLEIPYDIARIIADRIDTNVRELEGALIRLQALCSLLGEKPSQEIAQKVIDTIAPSKNKEVTTDGIKQIVARQFNVSINDLSGKRRTQNIALARQVAMYLCRKHTARSFPEIGALFGGRDHSTVIHAIKAVGERLQSDAELKTRIEVITSELKK
jgi:chromosomal replication initiator protein